MDDLIKAVENAQEIEKKVEYYFTMTGDEKRLLLKGFETKKSEDVGILLNAIYPDEPDKDVRKMIRKMIFKLKSSGINVEEPRPDGVSVLKKVEEHRENYGFLTNYDYSQSRLVVAAYEVRKNTFVFLNGEIHFREGLRELMSSPVSKRDLDELIRAYRVNTVEPAFISQISPAYAAFIVEEGSGISGKFSDAVGSLKNFAAHIKDPVHRSDDIYTLPVMKGINPAAPDTILNHSIFTPFSPTWGAIAEDRKEYLSGTASTIVLPPRMEDERKNSFIKALVGRDDMAWLHTRIKRLLEDYAYFFYFMEDYGRYRGLIEILKSGDTRREATAFFVRKSLEAPQEKKPASSGLIVSPYG
ncbi:MAG: hypothetical protein ACYDHW_14865 [Syntrophorhabdaceae bacterium]